MLFFFVVFFENILLFFCFFPGPTSVRGLKMGLGTSAPVAPNTPERSESSLLECGVRKGAGSQSIVRCVSTISGG